MIHKCLPSLTTIIPLKLNNRLVVIPARRRTVPFPHMILDHKIKINQPGAECPPPPPRWWSADGSPCCWSFPSFLAATAFLSTGSDPTAAACRTVHQTLFNIYLYKKQLFKIVWPYLILVVLGVSNSKGSASRLKVFFASLPSGNLAARDGVLGAVLLLWMFAAIFSTDSILSFKLLSNLMSFFSWSSFFLAGDFLDLFLLLMGGGLLVEYTFSIFFVLFLIIVLENIFVL